MQFPETFCKPSSCITVVPVGLPVVLKYNEKGLLQNTHIGWKENLDTDPETFSDIAELANLNVEDQILFNNAVQKFVPYDIPVKGGTTWVYGILYSEVVPCDDGVLPNAVANSYVKWLLEGKPFKYYGGYVKSLASSFRGPLIVQNFLKTSKFNPLPQVIVPLRITDDTILAANRGVGVNFNPNFISGFFVFEELDCRYVSMNLRQVTLSKNVEFSIDPDGAWNSTITDSNEDSFSFSYSAFLHHRATKCATLLIQNLPEVNYILSTRVGTDAELMLSTGEEVKCPICGKVCIVGRNDAAFKCDDPHCMSHQYGTVSRMLKTFNLPELPYDDYMKSLRNSDVLCLTDIFELKQYKDLEIKTTLAKALYAVIDTPIDYSIVERFANKCNNNTETVMYYMNNPLRVETDLDIVEPGVKTLIKWLEDPYNISTVATIFDIVTIEERDYKFEGDPIFRGSKFVLTGRFKRGNTPEIESILRSYSAEVSTSIEQGEDLPNAVILGGLNDGISGQLIQKAKIHNIPIVDEDEFFTSYEIDQDLRSNLL